jgi:hypothetical protein
MLVKNCVAREGQGGEKLAPREGGMLVKNSPLRGGHPREKFCRQGSLARENQHLPSAFCILHFPLLTIEGRSVLFRQIAYTGGKLEHYLE